MEMRTQELRPVGKCGALPRVYSTNVPVFERYLTTPRALPAAPFIVDRMSKVTSWPMYLNDQLGDCTCAGMLHSVAAWTAFSGRVAGGALFTDDVCETMYSAVGGYRRGDPSTDNGATLQAVAQYMTKTGVKDTNGNLHKIAAWAQVGDPTNLGLLKRILNTFGTVYCAFDIDQAAETQFAQGKIWTPVSGSPTVGGHCIPMQFSEVFASGTEHRPETFITWGAEQGASIAWVEQQITEALVLVSYDWLDRNGTTIEGLNLNALIKDMQYV